MAKKFVQYSGWVMAAIFGIVLLSDDEEKPIRIDQSKSLKILQQQSTSTEIPRSINNRDKPNESLLVDPAIKNNIIRQVVSTVVPILKIKPPEVVETKPVKVLSSLQKKMNNQVNVLPKINSPLGFKYISKNSVNVRAKPTIKSAKVGNLKLGTKISYISIDRNWFQIEMPKTNKVGWIRGDLLADKKPKLKLFIPFVAKSPKRTGPIRAPYYGTCDCPYDRTKRGGRCGGRSAYSRPGGRSPRCYF
ncbi:MAG: SH3 domain-containing protein [Hyphomicrobiales bacterium]